MTNHPNRARRRYGHLPGHIRDAFLEAIDALADWNPSGPLPPARVSFEVRYRTRQISVAEACGLVWGCTDVLPGDVFQSLTEDIGLDVKRQTYAAAAHAMLHYLKGCSNGVNAAADESIKRLYDKRDELWDRLEIMIAVRDLGKPPTALDQVERFGVRNAAYNAVEFWEERSLDKPPPEPRDAIDRQAQAVYALAEEIAAIVDTEQFGEGDDAYESSYFLAAIGRPAEDETA
jgi:hypothetical protein